MSFNQDAFILFPTGWLLILVAIINIGWIIYIFNSMKFDKKRMDILFAFLAGSGVLWVLTNAYFHSGLLIICSKNITIAVALLSNIAGGFVIINFYYLSCVLRTGEKQPYWQVEDWRIPKIPYIFILSFCILNIVLNTWPGLTIDNVDIISKGNFILKNNSLSWLFFLLLSLPIIPSIINLYKAIRIEDMRFLIALYSLAGVLVCYSSAIIFSIILPIVFNEYRFTWIPPFLGFVPVSLFGYALSGMWLKEKNTDNLIYVVFLGYALSFLGLIFYFALLGLKAFYLGLV